MAFTAGREQILALGDSITEQGWGCKGGLGWLSILANAYRRRADVLSRGYGGYTTRTLSPPALQLLAAPLSPHQPRYLLITVYLGSNDCNAEAQQHVPVAEYTQRLQALLGAAAGVARCVLCLGPGPMDDRRWPQRSNAASAAYNAAARAACAGARAAATGAAAGTPILFASLLPEGGLPEGSALGGGGRDPVPWLDLLSDGLHLSSAGNAELAALVQRTLAEQCPAVAPEALPYDFPPWNSIPVDAQDAAAAAFTPEALAAFRKV
jgi:lysophospholipase L1-like esterase